MWLIVLSSISPPITHRGSMDLSDRGEERHNCSSICFAALWCPLCVYSVAVASFHILIYICKDAIMCWQSCFEHNKECYVTRDDQHDVQLWGPITSWPPFVASQSYLPWILLFMTQEFSDDVCSSAGHMSDSRVNSTKPNMVWTFWAVKRFLDTLTAADGRVSLHCERTHSRCQWSCRSTRYSCQRHRDV